MFTQKSRLQLEMTRIKAVVDTEIEKYYNTLMRADYVLGCTDNPSDVCLQALADMKTVLSNFENQMLLAVRNLRELNLCEKDISGPSSTWHH